MNKIKYYLSVFTQKITYFFKSLYAKSYGFDELNKLLLIISFGLSIIDIVFKSKILSLLSTVFMILFFLRYFSSKRYARSEENRTYRKYKKLIKTKWDFRKTHKIYMCKQCGQLIRVPKGKGRIETTCPSCGNKETHRS